MSDTMWIGPDESLSLGEVGFLVEFSNPVKDSETLVLRDTPACGNQSGRPILDGWCGSYNDLSTYGRGMAKVIKIAKNGRVQVQEIAGEELADALEELGYPELIPDA